MGKFGEGNLELNITWIQIHAQSFFNSLKHRNSMLNTKYVLSSLLWCPFEVLNFRWRY